MVKAGYFAFPAFITHHFLDITKMVQTVIDLTQQIISPNIDELSARILGKLSRFEGKT